MTLAQLLNGFVSRGTLYPPLFAVRLFIQCLDYKGKTHTTGSVDATPDGYRKDQTERQDGTRYRCRKERLSYSQQRNSLRERSSKQYTNKCNIIADVLLGETLRIRQAAEGRDAREDRVSLHSVSGAPGVVRRAAADLCAAVARQSVVPQRLMRARDRFLGGVIAVGRGRGSPEQGEIAFAEHDG
jgi:hypothetical protein